MPSKILLKKSLFNFSMMGALFSAVIILFLVFDTPAQSSYIAPAVPINSQTANTTAPEQKNVYLPIRLRIPKIKIDIALEHVGLTSQGAVDVPKGKNTAAWFKLGPRPGENGNAVITGHYGWWKNGTPTVFNNLNKLRPGDKLYITDEKGATITFRVRELRTYNQKIDASDVFISSDGKSHLNLITCAGAWNKISQGYSKRLVVFTDKE